MNDSTALEFVKAANRIADAIVLLANVIELKDPPPDPGHEIERGLYSVAESLHRIGNKIGG